MAASSGIARKALIFLWLGAATYAGAQGLAASLSQYQASLRVAKVAGVTATSFSGITFHPETRTLYVIDDANSMVYELDAAGVLLRSITTSGFTDTEGIGYQGDDFFFIAEEGLANIVRVKLPRTGSGPVAKSGGALLNLLPNQANSGIEGVSYRAGNNTVYAVKEIDPPRLYRITLNAQGNPAAAFPNEPFNLEAKSGDAADVLALNDGTFLIVNQEQNKLEGYGPQGQALSSLALGMNKPEGIALDTATGTLYVVGEQAEFTVFKSPNTRAQDAAGARFSFSALPGPTVGAPLLRLSLPYRGPVRLAFGTLEGRWTEVFGGVLEAGDHVINPGHHAMAQAGARAGVGFYRLSAGRYQGVTKVVTAR